MDKPGQNTAFYQNTVIFRQKKNLIMQCRKPGFNPWVGKTTWRMEWLPTPVFLPGKSHRQRKLAGDSPWCTSDTVANAGVWTDALKAIRCLSGIQTYWVPCSFTFLLTCFQKEAEKGNRCFVRLPVTHRVPARGTDPGDPPQLVPCDPPSSCPVTPRPHSEWDPVVLAPPRVLSLNSVCGKTLANG